MTTLREILENSEDNKEYIVTFRSGNKLGLKDFEPVDKTIYGKDNLFVGWVVSQVKCDKRFFTPGTGFQFALNDVQEVIIKDTGEVLYESTE